METRWNTHASATNYCTKSLPTEMPDDYVNSVCTGSILKCATQMQVNSRTWRSKVNKKAATSMETHGAAWLEHKGRFKCEAWREDDNAQGGPSRCYQGFDAGDKHCLRSYCLLHNGRTDKPNSSSTKLFHLQEFILRSPVKEAGKEYKHPIKITTLYYLW